MRFNGHGLNTEENVSDQILIVHCTIDDHLCLFFLLTNQSRRWIPISGSAIACNPPTRPPLVILQPRIALHVEVP
jgi:hypothetical protein